MFNCAAGREEHCKQISLACVGSARSVWATLGLPLLTACMLSRSTLLRLQLVLQGNCLRRALGCVLSPSGSGSRVLHKGVLCPSKARAAQVPRCLASALSPGGRLRLIASPVPASQFRHLRCAVCLLWGADLWLRPSWRMSTIQNPRKTWLATGSLLAVW